MSIPLPAFLLRRALLKRARELLEARNPRAALAILGDPLLAESRAAHELAARAQVQVEALAPTPVEGETNSAQALKTLLADLRAQRNGVAARAPASGDGAVASDTTSAAIPLEQAAITSVRYRLAVDDAGEYLVVSGTALTIGHLSSHASDLPFLSGIEREHARLELALDFHGGSFWRIRPIGAARVVVDGRIVDAAGSALTDGDRVRLGQNLDFVFRARDAASSSAILDLQHGVECCGAARVLLFASGAEGRVRIGAKRTRHIQVAGLEHEIALEMTIDADSARALSIRSLAADPSNSAESKASEPAREFTVACPPRASQRFSVGPRTPGRPPFSIVVSPLADELGEAR